jgi:peptidoglycan-associated lipoprotein
MILDLSTKSVFFDTGSHAIKPEYDEVIRQVYEFLVSAPQVSLTLAGNADERGKMNRALGQKRAEAVKRALVQLGVAEKRLEATSLAAKKPRAACRDKKCLAENRRVDLIFHGTEAAK